MTRAVIDVLAVEIAGRVYRADAARGCDLSIAIRFDGDTVQAFGAAPARSEAYCAGSFVGDVTRGGSCNCHSHHLTPHCNGTHTESVGHLTSDAVPVNALVRSSLMPARLISIAPTQLANGDQIITQVQIEAALHTAVHHLPAIIIRTLPNGADKPTRNHDAVMPAYFEPAALAWLAQLGVQHLLTDLPSVDRMDDGGRLLAHRAFWGLPPGDTQSTHAARPDATITELIYAPSDVPDGDYLLSLQLAPLVADATPSRPLLYPLLPT